MHLIDGPDHSANTFTEGDPLIPTPATVVTDDWLNAVQAEIAKPITDAGIALSKPDNTQLAAALAMMMKGIDPGGRLSLVTGNPVGDASNQTTVRYVPFRHNGIWLYNGTTWVFKVFTETSQALSDASKSPAAASASRFFDMFAWDDAGTVRVTRGYDDVGNAARVLTGAGTHELEFFQGRWVNKWNITNGPQARRGLYVGTIYVNAAGQVSDDAQFRHVWNLYNGVEKRTYRAPVFTGYTYSTNTWRISNADTTRRIELVHGGVVPQGIDVQALHVAQNSGTGGTALFGIGLANDSNAPESTGGAWTAWRAQAKMLVAATNYPLSARLQGTLGGNGSSYTRTELYTKENHSGTGTTTWAGYDGFVVEGGFGLLYRC